MATVTLALCERGEEARELNEGWRETHWEKIAEAGGLRAEGRKPGELAPI